MYHLCTKRQCDRTPPGPPPRHAAAHLALAVARRGAAARLGRRPCRVYCAQPCTLRRQRHQPGRDEHWQRRAPAYARAVLSLSLTPFSFVWRMPIAVGPGNDRAKRQGRPASSTHRARPARRSAASAGWRTLRWVAAAAAARCTTVPRTRAAPARWSCLRWGYTL